MKIPRDCRTSEQAAMETGATLRMLQYWDEQGIIAASWAGRIRYYTRDQMKQIGRLVALRRSGVSLEVALDCPDLDWKSCRVVMHPIVIGEILLVPLQRRQA